jgi:uncharacterized protein
MTVEARPLGVACQLSCSYCYQEPLRTTGNSNKKYSLDKMIEQIEKVGQDFNLFGGEALLIPKRDLERMWRYGFERFGKNGIQTNGALIDDDHIKLFKEFNVNVGVSIDGWGDLNSLRTVRGKESSNEKTLESTNKTVENILKLRKAGISVGIIITLHRQNGVGDRLQSLLNFIRFLGDNGVRGGNIHTLEVDETMRDQEINVLSNEENIEAFLTLAKFFEENKDLSWNPFAEMRKVLHADDSKVNCTWKSCDPLNTQAVYGVEGDGALSNCGRTNKEGIEWYKADKNAYLRYISLYNTPDEMGGCKGCRFFMACGGSCPGESDKGDFRNKTIHCGTQKALLGFYEQKIIEEGGEPITLSPLRPLIEGVMLESFAKDSNAKTIAHSLSTLRERTFQLPILD